TGTIGQYLLSFGVVSAAAILFSMFISFTLTPALCSMLLRSTDVGENTSKQQGFYAFIERTYGKCLHWSLVHRPIMLTVAAIVTLSAVLLYPRVGQELVPDDDQSEFGIGVNLPNGTSFERTADYVKDIEGLVRNLPEVATV